MWDPLVDELGGFRTIAFDAPGTRESDTPRWPLRMRGLARVTAHLLAALGQRRVDLLGVSHGGPIARSSRTAIPNTYGGLCSRLGHAPSLRGYLWQLAAIAGWCSLFYVRRTRQPALMLTGDEDPIIRIANGQILARLIPRARPFVGAQLSDATTLAARQASVVLQTFAGGRGRRAPAARAPG